MVSVAEVQPVKVTNKLPSELVKGWETGYRRMLTQLVKDLQASAVTSASSSASR